MESVVKKREWLFRLALLAFSSLLTLLVAEVALRIVGIGPPPTLTAGEGLSYAHYDPQLGWDLVPGTQDRHATAEFDVEIRINDIGLRDQRDQLDQLGTDPNRLLVLGDSFSFGHGVELEEAYPHRLEQLLDGTQVLNLSVAGYGTDQQLLRYQQMGLELGARDVLLGLFVGDVFRNDVEVYNGYAKPRFELAGGELRLGNVPVPTDAKGPDAPMLRLAWLLGSRGGEVLRHLGYGPSWPLTTAILERLQEVCEAQNARLRVVIIPKDRAVTGNGWRQKMHLKTVGRSRQMVSELGIDYLDLTPALAAHWQQDPGQLLYYPLDGHWTAAGHRVAAQAIADWLEGGRQLI